MLRVRKAGDRFHTEIGWLDSRHTFSFGGHYDPDHMGFRALRVINDDRVTPGAGFPTHGHRDMEIISYVVDGALAHRDSMGNGSVIKPGDVQRMSAGRGVTHSEHNPQDDAGTRFLQIWIIPAERGLPPSYEQRHFSEQDRRGRLRLVGSPDGADGSIRIHQDVRMYAGILGSGDQVEHPLEPGRSAWVQVVRGRVEVDGQALAEGDGAAISGQQKVTLLGRELAEVLLFDLA